MKRWIFGRQSNGSQYDKMTHYETSPSAGPDDENPIRTQYVKLQLFIRAVYNRASCRIEKVVLIGFALYFVCRL